MESVDLKALADEIRTEFAGLRGEVEAVKGRDVVTEEKFGRWSDDLTKKLEAHDVEVRKLRALAERPGGGADDDRKADLEAKAAFDGFMRHGRGGSGSGDGKSQIEVRAMSTNVQADGGYLVRPQLVQTVVSRIFETSPLRGVANVETGTAKSIDMLVDDDEAVSAWVGEGVEQGATATPQLGERTITAHAQRARPSVTIEQLQDSYLDVEAWLMGKVADKFGRTENTAFVNGNGVGKPRGFLTYAAWGSAGVYERDKIEQRNLGTAAALNADGLIRLQGDLKEAYQARAVWGMKRATYAAALTLKGADNYFFGQTLLRDGQLQAQLLGKPVIFMDDMPTVAAGNLAVVYADFSDGYTIYDRVGLQIIRDPYTLSGNLRVRFVVYKRVGGDVTGFDSIKIGKIAE